MLQDLLPDFPVQDPSTTDWLHLESVCGRLGPAVRHHWWRQMLNVTNSEKGSYKHLRPTQLPQPGVRGGNRQAPLATLGGNAMRINCGWPRMEALAQDVPVYDTSFRAGPVPKVSLRHWNAGCHHSWRRRLQSSRSDAKDERNLISWRRRRCTMANRK